MRKIEMVSSFIALLIVTSLSATSQDQVSKAAIQKKLESQYALTQPTADNTDIVTAGAVVALNRGKGNLMMVPVSSTNLYQNVYKDGKIAQNAIAKVEKAGGFLRRIPGVPQQGGTATRTFVPGEKMWVTKIDVRDDGVVFDLFTDAIADVRYKASLKFAFAAKGSIPPENQIEKLVGEVLSVDNGQQQQQTSAAGSNPQPPANPAPRNEPRAVVPAPPPAPAEQVEKAIIPPPPPPPTDAPPAAPKTIALGQTIDQVVAILGPPQRIVKLPTKETYYYPDMKVIFVGGKVKDVQ